MDFILGESRDSVLKNIIKVMGNLDGKKKWLVKITVFRDTRSGQQNKYLWGVVYRAVRDFVEDTEGITYSVDVIHEYFKERYLIPENVFLFDVKTSIYKSTKKLTKKDFAYYLEKIYHEMAERGCVIPPPEFKPIGKQVVG